MDFLNRMTEVIDYIEEHITEEIDFNDVAKIAYCGIYQFGRIFSYVVGVSFAEYIRNRRLSLAALEIKSGGVKVIDIAMKYGYNSPESFTRAFREMHGVSPIEARSKSVTLKMFPRISFQILIKGAIGMDYRIEEKKAIKCVGKIYTIAKGEKVAEGACVAQNAWNLYLDVKDKKTGRTPNETVAYDYKLDRAPLWQVGLAQNMDDGSITMSIGAEIGDGTYPDLDSFEIPAGTWAMFFGKGKVYAGLDALFTRIFTEWLPSSGYEQSMQYIVEIYPPGDAQSNDYAFEIWIPVKKK